MISPLAVLLMLIYLTITAVPLIYNTKALSNKKSSNISASKDQSKPLDGKIQYNVLILLNDLKNEDIERIIQITRNLSPINHHTDSGKKR